MAMKGAKALEVWSKRAVEGYPGVRIANMSGSWRDGKAFCAIIHRYRPHLIDWVQVEKNDVKSNCTLAFTIAEKELDIPSLLDPQDMADCTTPDRLSILTYLSEFYHKFKDEKSPLGSPSTIIVASKKSSKPASVISPSKNNQVIVTSSTRDFVSNYLQGTAKMICSVGNIENNISESKEMKDKVETGKKKDTYEKSKLSNYLGGVTGMICAVNNTLSSVEKTEEIETIDTKKKEMPEQIILSKEKLENPHISIEKELIPQNDDAIDVAKLNEKNVYSEKKAEKISNTLSSVKDLSENTYGARKKETKYSQDDTNNTDETSNNEKENAEEVVVLRDSETHGGDLKRKDSCDSGVSLSPLGSACNSPPSTRPDKSSNVAKAVELFKSQNEMTFKGVNNLWRNKTQSNSIDQIIASSLINKTEEKYIKVINGAKANVKDGICTNSDLKYGVTSDKDDKKGPKDNLKSAKGGVIFSVNNNEMCVNNEIKNKTNSNDTSPLYNPKPYRPWGANVLKMTQSFTNNKNKFISQTTLNSPDPVSLSSQGPASLSTHKSTPSLFIKNSSYGPTSLSIKNSPPSIASLSNPGSSSIFTQKSSGSSLSTQKSCPSLLLHKSSTGPTSLSILNSPPFPSSFHKSYAGPASLLIHNSPPLPTSLPPGPASFSSQTSFPDQTSVIFCKSSSDTESPTSPSIANLSSDLEAVKIIESFPDSVSSDLKTTKTNESSLNPLFFPENKISPDKSSLSINTSSPDQSFISINNSSSDQSFFSLNNSSAFKPSYSLENSSSEPSSELPTDSLDKTSSVSINNSSLPSPEPSSVSKDTSPRPQFPSIHLDVLEEKVEAKQSECDKAVSPNATGPLSLNTPRHLFSTTTATAPASGPMSLSCDRTAPVLPSVNRSMKCDKAAPTSGHKSMICDLYGPMSLGCDRPVTVDNAQPSAGSFKAAMRKFRSMTCISQVVVHAQDVSPTTTHFPAGQTKVSPPPSHGQTTEQTKPSGRKDIPEYARWKVSSSCKPDRHRLNIETTAKPDTAINKTAPAVTAVTKHMNTFTTANPATAINKTATAATAITKDTNMSTTAPASSAVTKDTSIAGTRHDAITITQNHLAIDTYVNNKQGGEVIETVNNGAGADITDGDNDITNGDHEGTGDEAGNKRWADDTINKQTEKPRLRKSVSLPHTILHSEYVAGNQPFTITI